MQHEVCLHVHKQGPAGVICQLLVCTRFARAGAAGIEQCAHAAQRRQQVRQPRLRVCVRVFVCERERRVTLAGQWMGWLALAVIPCCQRVQSGDLWRQRRGKGMGAV